MRHRIAVLPGDGIGNEVMPEALRVLDVVGAKHGVRFEYRHFDWSCETYKRTGAMMPADGLARLRDHDAILLGAVGWPGVPDHISLWGLLLPIRREFDQYVNLRPVKLLTGVRSPLRDADRPTSTSGGPREQRGRVLRARRPAGQGPPRRWRCSRRSSRARHRSHHALRLRAAEDAAATST